MPDPRSIIGVVGCGLMGSGIAEVSLNDAVTTALEGRHAQWLGCGAWSW